MDTSARVFFELIDQKLDDTARDICNRIFSVYKDVHFTPDQRKILQPLVKQELDALISRVLKLFDNVGGVLPDEVSGWTINDADDGTDISDGNTDYADMWWEYLQHQKTRDED